MPQIQPNIFADDFDTEGLSPEEKQDAIIGGLLELNEKFDELLEKLANLNLADFGSFN